RLPTRPPIRGSGARPPGLVGWVDGGSTLQTL
ncbi:hypothetical protein AK812_SmicGene48786, partial [Symbiodinium microadriaticum]